MKIEELLQTRGIIHRDPEIMSGVPVFVGSRVPLKTFFDYLEGESGFAEFINDFPYLESQAIKVLDSSSTRPDHLVPLMKQVSTMISSLPVGSAIRISDGGDVVFIP